MRLTDHETPIMWNGMEWVDPPRLFIVAGGITVKYKDIWEIGDESDDSKNNKNEQDNETETEAETEEKVAMKEKKLDGK